MRVLLLSDSHGLMHNMVKAVEMCSDLDMIIHLGDYVRDAQRLSELFPDITLEAVSGNNDYTLEYPHEKTLDIEGRKLFITHGHMYGVKMGCTRIIERGRRAGADAVFYGHTHLPDEMLSGNMLVINPGSIGLSYRGAKSTCCLLDISEKDIKTKFIGV